MHQDLLYIVYKKYNISNWISNYHYVHLNLCNILSSLQTCLTAPELLIFSWKVSEAALSGSANVTLKKKAFNIHMSEIQKQHSNFTADSLITNKLVTRSVKEYITI